MSQFGVRQRQLPSGDASRRPRPRQLALPLWKAATGVAALQTELLRCA